MLSSLWWSSRPTGRRPRWLLIAALGFCAACGGEAKRTSVLLVVIDTLRADKLGTYGGERNLTPHIDAFAERGVVFENASSHAPWTLPATASLLTSLYPLQHGAGGSLPNFTALDPEVRTLASVFRERGYATGAIVNVAFLDRTFGLTREFEHLDARHFESNLQVRSAEETTDAALTWMEEQGDEPFFLLVHYFDTHAVYDPPQPFRRRFAAPEDRETSDYVFGTREHMIRLRAGQLEINRSIIKRAEKLYDGEVAYTDGQVGRLFDGLEDLGLAGDTLQVLTSDHGEEFWDHGGFEHGHTLFSELTHIPLIVRLDGRLTPGRVSAGVGHVDVAPTLCELTDIAAPEQFTGHSLVPLARSAAGSAEHRSVLAHGNFWGPPLSSWREGPDKLILPADGGRAAPLLFSWLEDMREERDRASGEAQRVAELTRHLRSAEALLARQYSAPGAQVELSDAERDVLRGLGYVGDDGEQTGDRD
jgi:arylsulfatase A-like enzyme